MLHLAVLKVITALTTIASFVVCSPTESSPKACLIQPPYNGTILVTVKFGSSTVLMKVMAALRKECEARPLEDYPSVRLYSTILINKRQLSILQATKEPISVNIIRRDYGAYLAKLPSQTSDYISSKTFLSFNLKQGGNETVDESFYNRYHVLEVFEKRWRELSERYKDIVRIETIGKSVEKRDIYALRIGQTSPENPTRVLINSLQHAREWITPMASLYVAERFAVEIANNRSEIAKAMGNVELIVLPMVNPDGYVYTQIDRLWRKNRNIRGGCLWNRKSGGVDLNRNWAKDFRGGEKVSSNPCSDTFSGPTPFSEPETRAVRDFIVKTVGIYSHIDIHSYGQFVLGPWAHTRRPPPRVREVDRVGKLLESELGASGENYKYGRGGEVLYLASGIMSDWTFSIGILAYAFELRPGLTGSGKFELPTEFILPAAKDTYRAISRLTTYSLSAAPKTTRSQKTSNGLNRGAIIGIAVGASCFVVFLLVTALVMILYCRRK